MAWLKDSFRYIGLYFALAAIWVYFAANSQYFFTKINVLTILLQASNVGIIAAGLTVVMIAAEIDLSIGSVEALCGAVAAVLIIQTGVPVTLGIILALGVAVLAGAISGLLTARFQMLSFISTLAMLGIAQGAAFLLTNGKAVYGFPSSFGYIGNSKVGGVSMAVIIAVVVFIALHLMLTRTQLGRHIFAVGGNAEAAAYAGISVRRIKLITLMISGFTAGIGGLILSSRLDAGNGLFGASDLLNAVAAVVIGGTSLTGGVGSLAGTATGVLIVSTIANGMVLLNVAAFWQQIVVGTIIIASVLLDQAARNVRHLGSSL